MLYVKVGNIKNYSKKATFTNPFLLSWGVIFLFILLTLPETVININ